MLTVDTSTVDTPTNIIANKYKLLEKIGEGSFGKVFRGENIRTKESVAIKMEPLALDIKLLKNESKAYLLLAKEPGFPRIKWFGVDSSNFYMVIDFLGPSLTSIKQKVGSLNLKIVMQLGIQIIQRIQSIHKVGLIHRDVKPDNFLLSSNKVVHLIDFGLCRGYRTGLGAHIPEKKGKTIIGSPNFISLNIHEGIEPSRRDDLESAIYVLFYLFSNHFLDCPQEEIIFEKQKLLQMDFEKTIFSRLFKYCRGLKFEDEPNYDGLINLLKKEYDNIA
jgi:serine/threonine protein kinase